MNKRKSETSLNETPEKVRKALLSTLSGMQDLSQIDDMNVEKMIEKWVTGSQSHILLSQEVLENIRLREIEQKCSVAESKVQFLEEKLKSAEETNSSLLTTVKVEGKMKDEIGEKMKTTCELVSTISEHFDFIAETFKRFQQHTDYLSKLYDTVILKQKQTIENVTQQLKDITTRVNIDTRERDDTKRLLEQQERELIDLRAKHQYLEDQTLRKDKLMIEATNKIQAIEKRQLELEAEKLAMQKIAEDYKNKITIEKNHIIDSFKAERDELIKERLECESEAMKFKAEYDKLLLSFQDIKKEKEKSIQSLIEKEMLISKVEKSVDAYKIQVQELINLNEEIFLKVERLTQERDEQEKQFKLELQSKNDENLKIRTDLNDTLRRNNELSESMNILEQRLIKEKEEQEKLSINLTGAKNKLEQSENRYSELVENLRESMNKEGELSKDREKWNEKICELNKKLVFLEQEKEKIQLESDTKIQNTIHSYTQLQEQLNRELLVQEQKYKECLVNMKNVEAKHSCELAKLESALAVTKDQNKVLKEKFYSVKESSDELQNKLKKSAEVQAKNTTSESQLRSRYERKQAELMATVKRLEEKEIEYLNKIKDLERQQDNVQCKSIEKSRVQNEIMPLISIPKLVVQSKRILFFDEKSSSDTSSIDIETLVQNTDERFEVLKIQDIESNSLQLTSDLPDDKQTADVAPEKPAPVTKKYFKHNIRTRHSLFKK